MGTAKVKTLSKKEVASIIGITLATAIPGGSITGWTTVKVMIAQNQTQTIENKDAIKAMKEETQNDINSLKKDLEAFKVQQKHSLGKIESKVDSIISSNSDTQRLLGRIEGYIDSQIKTGTR